jgi:hypothetical protein
MKGYWAPVSPKLGTKWEDRIEAIHKKGGGTNLVCSPELVFRGVSAPVLDLPYLYLDYYCLLILFIESNLVRTRSCKSSVLITPSFMKECPILLVLWIQWNWGRNRDQRVKLWVKKRVTFMDNSINQVQNFTKTLKP